MDKKDIKKSIDSMSVEELREVSGGWPLGKDKYTFDQYRTAGIIWRHYWLGKDKYCDFAGHELTQGEAEILTRRSIDGYKEVPSAQYDEFMKWKRGQVQHVGH